jgi:Sap, sulfolipid-1-addressing protein
MGVFLAMFSLRNVALLIASAGAIGSAQLPLQELAVTVAVFLAISSLGVLIPLLVRLLGGEGAESSLERWGEWLIQHMGTMTAAVMAVLGAYLLWSGITGLL